MSPLVWVFLSGVAGALYGLSYKVRENRGYSIELMLLLFSAFSMLFSFLLALASGEHLISAGALRLGLPYGLTMVVSMSLYFRVTRKAKLNVTWTVIQFSVLIPFLVGVLVYGERPGARPLAGTGLIFLSILFFGLGRGERTGGPMIPDLLTGVFLVLSALFTGLSMVIPQVFAAGQPHSGPYTLLLYRGACMTLLTGTLLLVRLRLLPPRPAPTFNPGLVLISAHMGLMGLLVPAFLIAALQRMDGALAFPLRTIVNLLFVFLLSFALFRERVSALEGCGVATAAAGIVLVSSAAS